MDNKPQVYKQIDVRSDKRAKERAREHKQTLKSVVSEAIGSAVIFKYAQEQGDGENVPLASIEERKNRMEIVLPNPESLKAKKKHHSLFTAVLSIFEVAIRERTEHKQRQKFAELLQKLLSKW